MQVMVELGNMELSSGQKSSLVFVAAFVAAGIVLSNYGFPILESNS
jgi:hypothetical protein